jgi:hypothetical protein
MKIRNKYYQLTFAIAVIGSLLASDSYAQTSAGWTSLFDGKTLKGWKQATGKATYVVENGQIVGTTVANSPNSFLVTEKEYGNFILELDAKVESPKVIRVFRPAAISIRLGITAPARSMVVRLR